MVYGALGGGLNVEAYNKAAIFELGPFIARLSNVYQSDESS